MYPHHGLPLPGEGGGAVLHEVVHVSQGAGVVLVRRQDLPQLLVPALTRDLGGEQVKISGGCANICCANLYRRGAVHVGDGECVARAGAVQQRAGEALEAVRGAEVEQGGQLAVVSALARGTGA